jgi:hypothetical protein
VITVIILAVSEYTSGALLAPMEISSNSTVFMAFRLSGLATVIVSETLAEAPWYIMDNTAILMVCLITLKSA